MLNCRGTGGVRAGEDTGPYESFCFNWYSSCMASMGVMVSGWQRRKAEREAAAAWREQRSWAIARCLKAIHDLPLPRPGDDDYAAHYALQQANAEWLEYAKEKEVLPD